MNIVDLVRKLPVHPTKRYLSRPLSAIRRIVLHHTAAPASQTPEEIARYHVQNRGYPGIGYHYLVSRGGTIYKCWTATTITACVKQGNSSSLCVCLIGNFTFQPPPSVQWEAALNLVRKLMIAHLIPIEQVYGHRETPTKPPQQTECPGAKFDMDQFRRELV